MTAKHTLTMVFLAFISCSVMAENGNTFSFVKNHIQLNKYPLNNNDEWIKVNSNNEKAGLSINQSKKSIFGNELKVAWNISDLISINFNVFENQFSNNQFTNNYAGLSENKYKMLSTSKSFKYSNKSFPQSQSFGGNERIFGYKFGLSSKLGLGRNYKLNINFDYGLMDGADLVGFKTNEINTSTFELGIRKNKFGASVNTDIFIEDQKEFNTNSRLGFELDWHFSDETTLSFGSKQRINNNAINTNSLDSLTGDIQYIKFKHNL